eukprot:s4115_g1.t1
MWAMFFRRPELLPLLGIPLGLGMFEREIGSSGWSSLAVMRGRDAASWGPGALGHGPGTVQAGHSAAFLNFSVEECRCSCGALTSAWKPSFDFVHGFKVQMLHVSDVEFPVVAFTLSRVCFWTSLAVANTQGRLSFGGNRIIQPCYECPVGNLCISDS